MFHILEATGILNPNQKGELIMKKLCLLLIVLAFVFTAVIAVAESAVPSTATYSVHILAEDWGCVADRVILSLDAAIEDASVYTYTVSETHLGMDWATFSVAALTGDKTITSAYLCDENGAAVEGASSFVALELAVSPMEGSPMFTNTANFGLNEWSDPYYMTVSMTGNGSEVVAEQACTAILTDTDMFAQSTYTAANGTTYQTALYSPENGADTLVVWLHGMGEGGNDIRLPLINVEMTALVSDTFQTAMGGAYVLVPQCPIYWMDNDGQGSTYVNGSIQADGTSFYTESLHELISSVKEQVGAAHVVIAGCSNGGYMTMMLAMNYGSEYDAYVPICEAVTDTMISDEQIALMASVPMFFIYAKNDPLVVPAECEEPTIARLQAAGAKNLHIFAAEDVHDTTGRFFGEDGQPLQQFGHGSWQYFFNNEALDADGVACWNWMGEQVKE